ncbi:extracellular solute-binding protein [Schumannella luteola]|uniref:Multiple sugar transport system substrate-binding protein n=1 Tax=Schumannella luteola TaxID=472059 RepID=A0A852YGT3_9MICO|nr:extracellular solute-binding protein [Schumannella luteola]NYH00535.1 multiple sugar transport system substrate-binding protein [Schumannella luteola]TPX03116.1 extracellular solute-binding protein [Schumannella luteola]
MRKPALRNTARRVTAPKRALAVLATIAAGALLLTGCSGSGGGDSKTIKVAYQKFGNFIQLDKNLKKVKAEYEKAHPGMKVELVPIAAQETDYFTKLALMNKSSSTAPDVMYEDTFQVKSDVDAGYLAPLDGYIDKWDDWDQFLGNAKQAGLGDDGKTYGISMGTDTRALWYNKELLTKAGIQVPWQPKTWDDVLDAAKAVKAKLPGVVPFNIYSGTAQGEASSMQGFEMLLYGTKDTLYDTDSKKWVTGSKGFTDSLQFIKDVYQGDLGPTPDQALDKNIGTTISSEWLPQGKLAISLDGSWQSGTWLPDGNAPWPEWNDVMGQAPMPTQDGQDPGSVSMSGGWTLAMGAKSKNKDAAWDFISLALNKENSLAYDVAASQIAVRKDVAEDPAYAEANPSFKFFSSIVPVTNFRPATADYSKISLDIQKAMEAVMTGQQSPKEAAADWDKSVVGIVGEKNTTK